MKQNNKFAAWVLTGSILCLSSTSAVAECSSVNWSECAGKPWVDGTQMDTPLGSKWWPNPLWGADDQAGSTNWYTKPEVVLRAVAEIRTGKVYRLGHPYTADMPLVGGRTYSLRIPGSPTAGSLGSNMIMWNDDFLSTEVGQVGTQFDGLGHVGVQTGSVGDKAEMRWYNGVTAAEMSNAHGLNKLGIEKMHPIVARGVMLDIAAIRGVEIMEPGDLITLEDVNSALQRQGMSDFEFKEGDAIIFRTGWEANWTQPEVFNGSSPGIGMEVARWVAEEVKAGLTGADTAPVEVFPNPDPGCAYCIHNFLQTRHGIVQQENMLLSELAADEVYVFTYMYSPVPIAGATGSMGAPIAIR